MKFLDEDCGGIRGRALKCVVPGGVSSKVLTAADITT
jgi:NADH:ubiquinone oxidoreductase subunit F (NADH-binding)